MVKSDVDETLESPVAVNNVSHWSLVGMPWIDVQPVAIEPVDIRLVVDFSLCLKQRCYLFNVAEFITIY